jgi:hypothetical protein
MNALFKNMEIKPPRTQAFESASLEINAIVPAPSFTLKPGQGMHFVKRKKKKKKKKKMIIFIIKMIIIVIVIILIIIKLKKVKKKK